MPRLIVKRDDQVVYTGPEHTVLVKGEIYSVWSVTGTGIQVRTNTGFAGGLLSHFKIA